MRLLLLLVFFQAVFLTEGQLSLVKNQDCKENESFQTCGTACKPSCETPSPSFCTLQCVVGCQCDKGFVRNANKACVTVENCSSTNVSIHSPGNSEHISLNCSANEVESDCHNPCTEKKCPTATPVMVNCLMMCQRGCTCKEGYVRNNQGQCVQEMMCPQDNATNSSENLCNLVDCRTGTNCIVRNGQAACVPNNIRNSTAPLVDENRKTDFSSSTSFPRTTKHIDGRMNCPQNQTLIDCLNTCSEKKCPGMEQSFACTKHCNVGCGCMDGFLRSNDGECYTEKDCPEDQICGINEEYTCKACEGTCKSPYPKCGGKNCTKECICAPGFVRKNGQCVTLKNCPSHTHENVTCLGTQDYTDCLPRCSQLCTGGQSCESTLNSGKCRPGCVCQRNYKIDSNGDCVHNRHCFKSTTCNINEQWSKCVNDENKCSSNFTSALEYNEKCFSGCICNSDFARNSDGLCVEKKSC